ncbi:hypothetical protein Leryth_004501 [Lithospermum erythrorhizon]|nr:hypothetical protein Leryth_004501 [Lithospermum erythrorhizon]
MKSKIGDISIQQHTSYEIVRSYLQHYGYEETLASFELATKNSVPPISLVNENNMNEEEDVYALNQRRTLRQLIQSGDIVNAFSKLQNLYPAIVQDEKSVICFMLRCQEFIELVRNGYLDKAILYGRLHLNKFYGSKFEELVKDCSALLAYEDPHSSSIGYLLQPHQRDLLADAVNAMILATNPNGKDIKACLHSRLDQLLRQLSASFMEIRSLNGDQGEAFHLWRVLDSSKGVTTSWF